MKPHATTHPALAIPHPEGQPRIGRVFRFIGDRFLWLPIGAGIAALWANVDGAGYFAFAHAIAMPVNQIGMALFVGLLVHEAIDAVGLGGALHRWHYWAMPVVAGAGSVLGSAFLFLAFVSWREELMLVPAWPVAGAVDVAAGYYVLTLIFRRHAAFAFLLVTGMVANAAGLLVIAIWPAFTPEHIPAALLVGAAMASAALLRLVGVRSPWPYVLGAGAVSWSGFRLAGVHPALALVPIVPFVPHARRLLEPFAETPASAGVDPEVRPWLTAVQVVLFLFGLANAGVMLRGYDTGTWAVLLAAVVGRPAGILAAVALARAAGLRLPPSLGWRELIVIALATSSGFTFALFTAASLLPVGGVLTQIRVGALATALGALVTYGAARALHVGRFARR